ncbi:hypothetical protein [Streptomyces sp. NPDC014793]|uniref:hypothetical protein n=1 Tax=Streptomyces sp. NPDC014793 TaxID=3364914 RepID=UPI0037007550
MLVAAYWRTLSGAVAEDLALYREKFRQRLPESLEELRGPIEGAVELPLHVAWSGMTFYDLGKPRQMNVLNRMFAGVLVERWARATIVVWRPLILRSAGVC